MTQDHTDAQLAPQTAQVNPALSRLTTFVGEWKWEASVAGQPLGGGRMLFEWLKGGAFLIGRSDAYQPEFPTTTTIIGCDDSNQAYCMLQYDSRAVARIYQMSLGGAVWKLWRAAPGFSQRFEGTFSSDGTTITGRWEKSEDSAKWEYDFDLSYTRVK